MVGGVKNGPSSFYVGCWRVPPPGTPGKLSRGPVLLKLSSLVVAIGPLDQRAFCLLVSGVIVYPKPFGWRHFLRQNHWLR